MATGKLDVLSVPCSGIGCKLHVESQDRSSDHKNGGFQQECSSFYIPNQDFILASKMK